MKFDWKFGLWERKSWLNYEADPTNSSSTTPISRGGLKWQNRDSICGTLISVCHFSWQRHSNCFLFLISSNNPLLRAFEVQKFSKNQVTIPNNLKFCIVKLYKTSIWWFFYKEQWNSFNLVPKPSHLIN